MRDLAACHTALLSSRFRRHGSIPRDSAPGVIRTVEEYEADLAERFRAALREIPGIKVYAAPDGVHKTPTAAFRVDGLTPREVTERMAREGFFVADGDFYASTLARKLGIYDRGGWIRAGLTPYNTGEEVEGFIGSLEQLVLHQDGLKARIMSLV